MEQRAAQLQLRPQSQGIAEVAVVGQGHFALHVVDDNGLGVGPVGAAGGAVAHMADGNGALGKFVQLLPVKHVGQQAKILVDCEEPIVIDHNAAALLTPVLQSKQPIVGQAPKVLALRDVDAENAAFFV